MSKAQAERGQKNGVEWRTQKSDGAKRYRWVINSAQLGKQQGDWTTHDLAVSGRRKASGEVEAGTRAPASALTVREAWAAFLTAAESGTATARGGQTFKPSSLRFLQNGWSKIDAHIGAQKLSAVRRSDVQDLIDRLGNQGMSAHQLRGAVAPLRIIYRRALVRDQVAVNPTIGVELPTAKRADKDRVVSRDRAAELLVAVRDRDRAVWATAMYAGLRRGELQALRWKHVDFTAGVIKVRRSYDTGGKVEQEPKSKNARRDVPIIASLRLLLEEHRELVPHGQDALVFGDKAQVYFSPPPLRNRALTDWKAANAARAANLDRELEPSEVLDPVTLHQCRHCFASFMIAAGCNVKALSVIVGHANIQTTFDEYGHLMPDGADDARRRLEAYLRGPNKPAS